MVDKKLVQRLKNLLLWSEYKQTNDVDRLNDFILANISIGIDYWTTKKYNKIFNPEEAQSITFIALREAAIRWKPEKANFWTYAQVWLFKYFMIEVEQSRLLNMENYDYIEETAYIDKRTGLDEKLMKDLVIKNGVTAEHFNLFWEKYCIGLTYRELKEKYPNAISVSLLGRVKNKIINILKKNIKEDL